MPLPARGGTTLSRLRRNAGKGGRALTLAHTHTPGRADGPHPPSTPGGGRGMYRPSGREQSAGSRGGAWRPTVTRPPIPATPSPAATRPSCRRKPPHSPHIFRQPLNWIPRTLAIRLPLKAEGPRDRGGKAPNSMTRWVSSSSHSFRNRPLNALSMAILPPNIIYLRTKLINF